MKIGNKNFHIGEKTFIMGILNVTPDSFSDGGKFNSIEYAIQHAREMIEQGADIIDIGGESTRPNHTPVGEAEEIGRVVPVIEALTKEIDVPISIDTYKGKVAELAIKAGANLINDVWGFKKDPYMAEVAGKYQVPCCIMHNRENRDYNNFIEDVLADLKESIDIAIEAGVDKDNIIIDPGIGFAKSYEQNLILMNNLERLKELNYPILLGTSRKSFIGNTLDLPVEERMEGTVATSVIGVMKGCDFVRVHDVLENKRACAMTDAIVRRS
ncbi:dihydropteroate synthase [Clostridium pasteurianum DSM 525 = ATCC 6013]|uniref:Dihydropteroate synthase n=1 Tax=Clostridium pasteurianum DSM 525 = ATCC 6013 TaxID=1262449 RepID=A0A0H3J333_CLOPA|nr:dihydropteroate synthase [Clostridium pasteurianum]AJA46323.1 dihydropteroate synthase [Clostridium pasteurianum DSM 525 = ATCC 6013]AJA50311.1 dihydropteroate synthase [Clostridium pasteurianum DSM 525 = ATCC 6013]AOZ73766.1 dihydropteroate synthase [Clostridium pasteurianum DSM 525 = ATCC 6013]AOZ77563.1 dihydropteroate synthase [Clostridium pasteurianum]ELP60900.1 dihydropteroate synthase [Clostridium pasteurianum DSM 525 = ATCC 6013]